jgi:intracellular multiplication protein IcmV
VPTPEHVETFEEAKVRLELTENDIQKSKDSYLLYAIIFVCLAAVTFSTSFFIFLKYHTFLGWLIANLVTILFLSQALRFHFWYFQIKHRKLGCTFQEWWHGKPNEESQKP